MNNTYVKGYYTLVTKKLIKTCIVSSKPMSITTN